MLNVRLTESLVSFVEYIVWPTSAAALLFALFNIVVLYSMAAPHVSSGVLLHMLELISPDAHYNAVLISADCTSADCTSADCTSADCTSADCTAGGGAQRSARNASGSKPRLPKPAVRMEGMPPPEAKLLNIAPAAVPPHAASVAMDPSAMLGAHSSHAVTAAATVAVGTASQTVSALAPAEVQKSEGDLCDRAVAGQEGAQVHVANGQAGKHVQHGTDDRPRQTDSSSPGSLPQLGLTVSPHKLHADADRPLSRLHSKTGSKSGRKSSTPRSNMVRASTGRPPRSGSGPGPVSRQDSVASDTKDGRKLTRRNTTG